MQNITEIVPVESLCREVNARGAAKYSDYGPVEGYMYVGNGARYGLEYN